jgi:hypothetical protein
VIPLPCGPIVVENFEDHMAPLRGPKDIPPAWIVEQNRGRWIAIAQGHPFAQAWRECPWEAAAACVASVLFWAGAGEPVAAAVVTGSGEPNLFSSTQTEEQAA